MTTRAGHLLADLPPPGPQEHTADLLARPGVRIERIVSHGQASRDGVWYDQSEDEWVMVVSGAARLRLEDEDADRVLDPGAWVYLPAHTRHRVTWTDPERDTVWLAVWLPPGG